MAEPEVRPDQTGRWPRGLRLLITFACVFIIVAGLREASAFCIPVAVGLILAAPLNAILKIALEHSEEYRPLAVLLGRSAPGET